MKSQASATAFEHCLRSDQIKTDEQTKEVYGRDWTRFYPPRPSAVLFPESTAEVQKIVQSALENEIPLVPSGGRTGLSGGAVAANLEVVVSLDRMNKILDWSPADRLVHVQAGVITEQLQQHARTLGYHYPVDFAARGSSQLGGNIATNAGGVKVLRYGSTRNWVAGLVVVTGRAQVLNLNRGLQKNATGYDLRHLFIGSEGTLGIITEALIQLSRAPAKHDVLVLGLANLDSIMPVLNAFSRIELTAFEMFSQAALNHVCLHSQLAPPFATQCPYYALIELELNSEATGELALEAFSLCLEKGWALDGVSARSETQARELWRLREQISESLAPHTPYKNDISVRPSLVTNFLHEVDELLRARYPHFEVVWFGHLGDGNLHINVLKPKDMPSEDFVKHCRTVDELLFATVENFSGSISAEHGVGLTKKPFLHYSRPPAEREILSGIKQIFDPKNIMNPNKLL